METAYQEQIEEKPPSKLWILSAPMSLIFLSVVGYWKLGPVRELADAKVPGLKEMVSRYFAVPGGDSEPAGARALTQLPKPPPEAATAAVAPAGPDDRVDWNTLAADRSSWPQTVTLKRATEFPAVVDGKVIGKIVVPVGSEARIVAMQNRHIGLEYRGGGAWVTPDATDLFERVRRHKS